MKNRSFSKKKKNLRHSFVISIINFPRIKPKSPIAKFRESAVSEIQLAKVGVEANRDEVRSSWISFVFNKARGSGLPSPWTRLALLIRR